MPTEATGLPTALKGKRQSPAPSDLKRRFPSMAYFNAGVMVVWHVFPELKSVHVFTSPVDVTICEGDTVCSAAPALPDLQMTANEVFYRKF